MKKDLAIITGGSRGLGAALCSKFVDMGYHVVEFSRSGSADYSVPVDLSKPEAAERVFSISLARLAMNEYSTIVGVNNAGVLSPIGPVSRKPLEDVIGNMNVNFISQILFIRCFLKCFQSHACNKTLVNISSGAALKGYSGWSLYCASKAGIDNFICAVAMEQTAEQHPIVVFNIDPHIMDTDMQAGIRQSSLEDFPTRARFDGFKEDGVLEKPSAVADRIIHAINRGPSGGVRLSLAEVQKSNNDIK